MAKKALYAGSFDPLTNGHFDIIKRASKLCDELVVGVISNPGKTPLIDIHKRMELIKEATKEYTNIKVDSFSGLLADYVNDKNYDMVIRGLRSGSDFENEIAMAQMNARLYKGDVETVFLMTCPEYAFLSSSMVKEVASLHGDVEGLVPEAIFHEIKKIYKI